jgi:anthranilate phosphoribosyltransferase
MSYATQIRQIEADAGLSYAEARALMAALLDGGVPEMETAAFLVALNQRDPGLDGWLGMHAALVERVPEWRPAAGAYRTVVLPTYHGMRDAPHLTPLLALLLRQFHIPVLIHGVLDGAGGTAAAYVLRELGVMPSTSVAQASTALARDGLAFAPVGLINPGLAALFALRARLGVDGLACRLATLVDPFGGNALRVVPVPQTRDLPAVTALLQAIGGHSVLLEGCEGEAFADPQRRPDMLLIRDGLAERIYEAQSFATDAGVLPGIDARATGAWIRRALAEHLPLPMPIRNQLALCLYAAGYTDDLSQARAITAINGFGRAAA